MVPLTISKCNKTLRIKKKSYGGCFRVGKGVGRDLATFCVLETGFYCVNQTGLGLKIPHLRFLPAGIGKGAQSHLAPRNWTIPQPWASPLLSLLPLFFLPSFLPFSSPMSLLFKDRLSCSPEWLQTLYIAKDGLEPLILNLTSQVLVD